MFDSKSLTKVQSVVLIAIIVVAAVGGAAYVMLSGDSSSDTIRIGVCADIDFSGGKAVLQGAILATEHVNAEGGILGRNITIVAEDDDTITDNDPIKARNAMNKLISIDKADFLLTSGITSMVDIYQEIVAEHKKILFHFGDTREEVCQKVLDDYDRYKYYFMFVGNSSGAELGISNKYAAMHEYTGLNKVALWGTGTGSGSNALDGPTAILNDLGMEVVHTAMIPYRTVDFSSYFVQAESRGAEIIIPQFYDPQGGVPLVKEYATRQSPTILYDLPYIARADSWEQTGGACNYVTGGVAAVVAGYPLTSYVIPFREAYLERWGEPVTGAYTAFAYDIVRYVLPDAIERAATTETDAVIAALEETNLEETSLYRDVAFSSSHDLLVTDMGGTYFQWQNGELKILYPKDLKEKDGVTYMFPDWPGPWD